MIDGCRQHCSGNNTITCEQKDASSMLSLPECALAGKGISPPTPTLDPAA